jgi:hypothetical protein
MEQEPIAYRVTRVEGSALAGDHALIVFKTDADKDLAVAVPLRQLSNLVMAAATVSANADEDENLKPAWPVADAEVRIEAGNQPSLAVAFFRLPEGMEMGFQLTPEQAHKVGAGLAEFVRRASSSGKPTAH